MNFVAAKIVVANHQFVYGAPQAVRDYLLSKKTKELVFIALPNASQRLSFAHKYKNGKRIHVHTFARNKPLGFFDYLIDVFQILRWALIQRSSYDLFIGADPLCCLCGLLLQKIGKVKRVIFYTIDFVPIRFKNPLINFLFHEVEKICVKSSNENWVLSPRIVWGREKFLHLPAEKYRQKIVPIGVWNKRIKRAPFHKIKMHRLVFVGHLLEKQGVQKVIEAVPLVVKRISDFTFLIIGGGDYEYQLRRKVSDMRLAKYVEFTGLIEDRSKVDVLLGQSACAVATYKPEKDRLHNFSYYADPTKVKDYLSFGLPVILTNVSYNARDIERRKCGIVVKYDSAEIAKAIIEFMQDDAILKLYRKNAFAFAREFDWENIFNRAFSHE